MYPEVMYSVCVCTGVCMYVCMYVRMYVSNSTVVLFK